MQNLRRRILIVPRPFQVGLDTGAVAGPPAGLILDPATGIASMIPLFTAGTASSSLSLPPSLPPSLSLSLSPSFSPSLSLSLSLSRSLALLYLGPSPYLPSPSIPPACCYSSLIYLFSVSLPAYAAGNAHTQRALPASGRAWRP
jgi:hypothetical protein